MRVFLSGCLYLVDRMVPAFSVKAVKTAGRWSRVLAPSGTWSPVHRSVIAVILPLPLSLVCFQLGLALCLAHCGLFEFSWA